MATTGFLNDDQMFKYMVNSTQEALNEHIAELKLKGIIPNDPVFGDLITKIYTNGFIDGVMALKDTMVDIFEFHELCEEMENGKQSKGNGADESVSRRSTGRKSKRDTSAQD